MSRIVLENVTKKYGETLALSGVSMLIDDSAFVVVLGPSGCGKTTLLRCIAGLETPESGHIYVDGAVIDDLSPRERDLSMVFQNYALFTHMTVERNIAFPLKVRNRPLAEIQSRVKEISRFLGIEGLLQKRPSQLSGGEQQRVAIARAIVREPRAFLMDEPLSNLDAPLRVALRTELKRIQREMRITTVYVTHDQLEALSLGTRIGVMNKGKLLQYDTPQGIYAKPAYSFVAGFVGSPPANLLHAALVEGRGEAFLKTDGLNYHLGPAVLTGVRSSPNPEEVVLAVRPEDISVSLTPLPPPAMECLVYSVEPLGPYTILNLKGGDVDLKATVQGGSELAADMRVWASFDESRIHVFDGATDTLVF